MGSKIHKERMAFIGFVSLLWGFSGGSVIKNPPTNQCRRHGFNPWIRKIPWRRKCLLTLVFLPGEFHGQRSLVGYSPWGRKESDTTEQLTRSLSLLELRTPDFGGDSG